MPLPHDLCSRLQNGFRARHKRIAVPHTVQNLGILTILLREGFISSVTRGTNIEPSPSAWHTVGPSQKRIWAELKYRDDRPVLNAMELISKPSKRITVDHRELWRLCTGRRAKFVAPLGFGEIAVVKTDDDNNVWMEAREAVQAGKGGEVVCRVR